MNLLRIGSKTAELVKAAWYFAYLYFPHVIIYSQKVLILACFKLIWEKIPSQKRVLPQRKIWHLSKLQITFSLWFIFDKTSFPHIIRLSIIFMDFVLSVHNSQINSPHFVELICSLLIHIIGNILEIHFNQFLILSSTFTINVSETNPTWYKSSVCTYKSFLIFNTAYCLLSLMYLTFLFEMRWSFRFEFFSEKETHGIF